MDSLLKYWLYLRKSIEMKLSLCLTFIITIAPVHSTFAIVHNKINTEKTLDSCSAHGSPGAVSTNVPTQNRPRQRKWLRSQNLSQQVGCPKSFENKQEYQMNLVGLLYKQNMEEHATEQLQQTNMPRRDILNHFNDPLIWYRYQLDRDNIKSVTNLVSIALESPNYCSNQISPQIESHTTFDI